MGTSMYSAPEETLSQGDVLSAVILPFYASEPTPKGANVQLPGLQWYHREKPKGGTAFTPDTPPMEGASPGGFVVTPYQGPGVILSQSCDLERIDDGIKSLPRAEKNWRNRRILVAPLENEDTYPEMRAAKQNAGNLTATRVLIAAVQGKEPSAERQVLESSQIYLECLRQVWAGEWKGVFAFQEIPPEEGKTGIQRSICCFDRVVSVPALWYSYLLSVRAKSITDPWRILLQEALRDWIGRYAADFDRKTAGYTEVESGLLAELENMKAAEKAQAEEKRIRKEPAPKDAPSEPARPAGS